MPQNDKRWHSGFGMPTVNKVISVLLAIIVIAIFAYGYGGLRGLTWGIGIGVGAIVLRYGAVIAVAVGISAGLSAAAAVDAVPIIVTGSIGCGGVVFFTLLKDAREVTLPRALMASVLLGTLFGALLGALSATTKGLATGVIVFAGLLTCATVTALAGIYLGHYLRPRLLLYVDLFHYLYVMTNAAVAFAVGYVAIALLCAGLYAVDWRAHGGHTLTNLPAEQPPPFGDILYFSLVTIGTLGYGDIAPASGYSKLIVAVELLLGLGWTMVVFTAVIAYLQEPFATITRLLRRRRRQLRRETARARSRALNPESAAEGGEPR